MESLLLLNSQGDIDSDCEVMKCFVHIQIKINHKNFPLSQKIDKATSKKKLKHHCRNLKILTFSSDSLMIGGFNLLLTSSTGSLSS